MISRNYRNYRIEAIQWLLSEECILARFYPLIPYREAIVSGLKKLGCSRKYEAENLTDEELLSIGLPNQQTVELLRQFLAMYDRSYRKMDKLSNVDCSSQEEKKELFALMELYHLPGVNFTRGILYFRSGYSTLEDIANSDTEEILEKTKKTIEEQHLDCKAPYPKEISTHIAVARAFTDYFWPHYRKDALEKRVVENGQLRIGSWLYSAPPKEKDSDGNTVACRMTDTVSGETYELGVDSEVYPYERDETGPKDIMFSKFSEQMNKLQQVVAGTEIESWGGTYKELTQRAKLRNAYDFAVVAEFDSTN